MSLSIGFFCGILERRGCFPRQLKKVNETIDKSTEWTGEGGRVVSINIGETLKETRLQKNTSISKLQQMTEIQKRYLGVTEQNDSRSLPGAFYVRALIHQCIGAVGLNDN